MDTRPGQQNRIFDPNHPTSMFLHSSLPAPAIVPRSKITAAVKQQDLTFTRRRLRLFGARPHRWRDLRENPVPFLNHVFDYCRQIDRLRSESLKFGDARTVKHFESVAFE